MSKGKEEERKGRERERKRKGKGGGEGNWKWSFGRNGKKSRTPQPGIEPGTRASKRSWCSTIEPPRQATSPASLFEILSVLPPLHNIGIIQCPQTKPASLGEPVTVAIVHRARPERTSKLRFASLPISLPPFPFLFLSLSLPFLSSSFPFGLPFAL